MKNIILVLGILIISPQLHCQQIQLEPAQCTLSIVNSSPYVDASTPVQLLVDSFYPNWRIICEVNQAGQEGFQIPTDKIFVRHNFSAGVDEGAGEGYLRLDKPVLVGQGSVTGGLVPVNLLQFRILNDDYLPSGDYHLNLIFNFSAY